MYNIQVTTHNIKHKGFTLIEALVLLFVFSVITLTFFQAYAIGARLIINSKNRLGATALANQKMEIIRSIDYDTIGTKHWNGIAWVYGIPGGDLLEDEAIDVNTTHYIVHTFVQYVDDPFDGKLGGSPNDAIPNDYKRVRLTVSWGDGSDGQSVSLVSNVSPNGIETSAGGGVLTINILDSTGVGVPNATVHIVNSSASIDVTTDTDSTGNITLPGTPTSTPAGTRNYVITVSKNGYFGTTTYPPYPTSTYNPVDVNVSVVANALNPITIVMDHASDIILRTQDPFGTSIPNVNLSITGGRLLGTAPVSGTKTYSLSQNTTTGASGATTFTGQSYGQYTVSFSGTTHQFFKLNPGSLSMYNIDVAAGVNKDVTAIFLDTQIGSLKTIIKNQSDNSAIIGASVHLSNASLGYDVTMTTDQYGYAYFPAALPALANGTYDITVSASGFSSNTGTVSISGSLQTKTISLTPS